MTDRHSLNPLPTIRQARGDDFETVHSLLGKQLAEHGIIVPKARLREVIKTYLRDSRWGFILIAQKMDSAVGVACVSFTLTLEHGGKSAWLDELYVIPTWRERGVGTALVQEALLAARKRGCMAMDLEVESDHQRAESLYQRAGFLPLSRTRWVKKLNQLPPKA